jgi:TPR repeat protein
MTVHHARAIVAVLGLISAFAPEIRLHAQQEPVAVAELRARAEQGDADAQFSLGVRYANGRGVAEDEAEAVRWYRLAAEQGYVDAQFNLGVRYSIGEGVPEDTRWCRLPHLGRLSYETGKSIKVY